MFYKNQLKIARENKLDIISLEVASEVEALSIPFDEKDFEIACSIVENAYIKSEDLSVYQLANALSNLYDNDKNILKKLSYRDLIDEACYLF